MPDALRDPGRLWRKGDSTFPVQYSWSFIWEQLRAVGAVITFTDITARKQLEGQIVQTHWYLLREGAVYIDESLGAPINTEPRRITSGVLDRAEKHFQRS